MRRFPILAIALFALAPGTGRATMPTLPAPTRPVVAIGTASLVSPSAAETYYTNNPTKTAVTYGPAATAPELVELARALKNSPDLIYEYVHNNIETVWMYGEHKGPLGTLIDKSGTAFDQAALMVALLQKAGYSAGFQAGTFSPSPADFTAWSGIGDAKAACQMLSSGGIPAAINGSSLADCSYGTNTAISSVTIAHIWVTANIPGSSCASACLFDPGFKSYTWKSGIDIAAASGFTSGTPLSQATGTATTGTLTANGNTVAYIKSLGAGALNTSLTGNASTLISYLQSNDLLAAHVDDIIGGGVIAPYYAPTGGLRQSSLANHSSSHSWSAIPNAYRTTLRITGKMVNTHDMVVDTMMDVTYFTDELYGRSMTVDTDFNPHIIHQSDYWNNTITLDIDGVPAPVDNNGTAITPYVNVAMTTNPQITSRGLPGQLTLVADHPYAASGGTYMDKTVSKNVSLVTSLAVVHAWGGTGPGMYAKWAEERPHDTKLPFLLHVPHCGDDTCPPYYQGTTGDFTRVKMAAGWLGQFTRAAQLHASIARSVVQLHHALGFVYGDATLTPQYVSHPGDPDWIEDDNYDRLDVDSAFSLTSKTADAVARRAAVQAIAASSATLEGGMAAQTADLPDTSSTATRFEWGNAPPASEDPSSAGARKFVQFDTNNVGTANDMTHNTAEQLAVAENMTTSTFQWGTMLNYESQPILTDTQVTALRISLGSEIYDYAKNGFTVVASQESFLGPGQRGGAIQTYYSDNSSGGIDLPSIPVGYYAAASKQRGGAFVATKYDANGDPLEIAHAVVSMSGSWDGSYMLTKGGGGGNQPDGMASYSPAQPADILKSRFVDKAGALGANLANGTLTPPASPGLEVGKGGPPYSLSANYSYVAGSPHDDMVSPPIPTQPSTGWTMSWQNNLALSGSGMEAMGASDVRAAAGTIVAFLATQNIYTAAQSPGRDVAAVLAQSWWSHQISGNVATVQLGTSSRQFVKTATGAWVAPGAGPYAKLTQTGARVPFEFICSLVHPPPYAVTRGWDNHGLSFTVAGRDGDVQHFDYWTNTYMTGHASPCGRVNGFRLTSWNFPNGIVETLTYGDPQDPNGLPGHGIERLTSVKNSMGRQINFGGASGPALDNNIVGIDGRSLSMTSDSSGTTFTDPALIQTRFVTGGHAVRSDTTRPSPDHVTQIFTADNALVANVQYDYDALGRIKQVRDAINLQVGDHTVAGGRDPTQFLIADGTRGERDDPLGAAYTVYYDTYGQPSRYIDELGRETDQEHDGRGRTTKTVYPELDYETLTYDARNNPLTLTLYPKPGSPEDIAGKTVVKAMAYTEGPTVADCVSILTCNKPAWSKSPNLFVTNYYWFSSGLLSKIKLPADSAGYRPETDFAYSTFGADGFSLLTSKTQWVTYTPSIVKTVTGYTYNASNFYVPQTVSVDPTGLNLVTTLSYDGNGDVTQVDGPRTDVTDISYFTYDNDRRNVFAISPDPDGAGSKPRTATKKTYDVDGRLFEADRGTTTSILATDFAINDWVKDVYDPAGNKSLETAGDPANGTKLATQFAYDGANRLLCTARRMNTATFASLPADGCALAPSGIYGADRIVKTIYDAAGQARQEVRGFGTPLQQVYATHDIGLEGEELSVADADAGLAIGAYNLNDATATAHQTNYAYDGFGRLNKTTYADNSADQVTLFDSDGNARIRLNRSGQTLSYTYDRNDRVLTRAMTGGATATWVYDLLNEVTSLSDAAGNALANTYDLAGRQLTASQTLAGLTGAKVVSYAYDDGAGDKVDRSQTIWPDGYAVTYAYDALGHLTTETDTDGMVLASRTYDNLARPATTQYPNASDNVAYSWDADDDLITLTDHFSNSGANVSFTNAFTPAKQWWTSNISSTTYEYAPPTSGTDSYATANGLNQYGSMTPAGGSMQTISYDTRGNLAGDGTWTFGYDSENRMLSACKPSPCTSPTVAATYQYDPLGRRTQKSGTGVTTTFFLHDGDSEIAEYDSGGSLVRRYVPGPVIDQPVAMVTCITSACTGANATKTFFHPDKMGSIVAMSDASGTRVEGAYRYDAWGNCIATGGVPCSTGEPYRYTGQRLDPETGLYYYRARYYSSKLGRFLQTDPIGYGPDMNWYDYVGDDPTDKTDPPGLVPGCGSRLSGENSNRCEGEAQALSEKSAARKYGKEQTEKYTQIYDHKDPNYHDFDLINNDCESSDWCNVPNVEDLWDGVPHLRLSGGDDDITLFPDDHVRHFSPGSHVRINETRPPHRFHPGRIIVFTFQMSHHVWTYVRGVGTAGGLNRWLDITFGPVIFQDALNRLNDDIMSFTNPELKALLNARRNPF